MSALVFILRRQGGEDGPYSEEEVLDALDEGELSPGDWCRLEGQAQPRRLGEVFERVSSDGAMDASAAPARGAGGTEREAPVSGRESDPESGEGAEDAEESREPVSPDRGDEDEVDEGLEDEGEYEDGSESEEENDGGETLLYRGAPSFLGYGWPLMLAVGVLAAGYWLGRFGVVWVGGALAVSLVLVIRLLVHRAGREYVVTTDRVVATRGLVSKRMREIPLRALASIRLHRSGLLGWLGVGTVFFSSDGGDEDDVVFERVGRVGRVIAVVREAQRRQVRR